MLFVAFAAVALLFTKMMGRALSIRLGYAHLFTTVISVTAMFAAAALMIRNPSRMPDLAIILMSMGGLILFVLAQILLPLNILWSGWNKS